MPFHIYDTEQNKRSKKYQWELFGFWKTEKMILCSSLYLVDRLSIQDDGKKNITFIDHCGRLNYNFPVICFCPVMGLCIPTYCHVTCAMWEKYIPLPYTLGQGPGVCFG